MQVPGTVPNSTEDAAMRRTMAPKWILVGTVSVPNALILLQGAC